MVSDGAFFFYFLLLLSVFEMTSSSLPGTTAQVRRRNIQLGIPTLTRATDVGEEILATYGAHSNDKLLVHYGFICASPQQHASADDEIRLDHVILPHFSEATKSQLQDVGFLGAYALLPSAYSCPHIKAPKTCTTKCRQPWDICFKTQVAVRAVLLTANEWEYFVTNGEDLSGDKSAAVNAWLRSHLQGLRAEAGQKIQALEALDGDVSRDHGLAVSMMRERWSQIDVHVGNFLELV